ncbi:MAG: hypothetical protein ACOX33_11880 [Dethiobacteria bacterium]
MAEKWEQAWSREAELCASVLNHLSGFRLNLYRHRGWDDILKEPLANNRMSAETLQVMWDAVEKNKDIFVNYLERKKKLLGLEKLSWFDLDAPLGELNQEVYLCPGLPFCGGEPGHESSPKWPIFATAPFRSAGLKRKIAPASAPALFAAAFP